MVLKPSILILKPGDVVKFRSGTAGYFKWHICLTPESSGKAPRFLYINSKNKSEHDAILSNADFPDLPPTDDGRSMVSFSTILPASMEQLHKFDAEITGKITKDTARKLIDHSIKLVDPPLTGAELRFIRAALNLIL